MAAATDAGPKRHGAWRIVSTNAVSKVLVMVMSGAIALVTTRLIIENFGIAAYAQYGLLTSMASLVPFADLGMSAAIINAIAGSSTPREDTVVRRTITSAIRILLISAGVLACIGLLLTILGLWPAVLGEGLQPGGATAALLCVLVFSATLPLGVGQRILTGLGKNHLQISAQALAAPFILATVFTLITTDATAHNFVAVLAYLASTLVAGVSLWLAARMMRPQVGAAIRDVPRIRTVPGVKVMAVAGPMLIQMIALPLAMQTDRLLLSHLAGSSELAQYNLGSQLFGLITATISAAGIALWPIFARARSDAEVKSPFGLAAGFVVAGVALAGILGAISPWLTTFISSGKIQLDGWLIGGFIAFVGMQAAKYPLGMYMTDLKGLRYQVVPILILVPVNLAISWALVAPIGAAGPIVGSTIAVFLCQVIPNFWYVRNDLKRRTRQHSVDSPGGPGIPIAPS